MNRLQRMMNTAREKATEILGEEGMEQLKSIRDDLAEAGNQVISFTEEVCEDCENDALKDAKAFYTGAANKVQTDAENAARKAKENAAARKAAREETQRRKREIRKVAAARAVRILICVIIAGIVIVSAAIWSAQHRDKTGKVTETEQPSTASVIPQIETAIPQTENEAAANAAASYITCNDAVYPAGGPL